jgi:signal transduction histidine kinase
MKKNNFLDMRFIIAVSCCVFVMYFFYVVFMSFTLRNSYSNAIISAVGSISDIYGDIDKQVIDNILNQNNESFRKGEMLLKQYGYGSSGYKIIGNSLNSLIVVIALFVLAVYVFILFCLYLLFKNHVEFIDRLENCLDDFNDLKIGKLESNQYTKNLINKLQKLSLNAKHNISLLQKEQQKVQDFMEDLSHQMKTPLTLAHLYIERYLMENKSQSLEKLSLGLKQLEKMTVLINSFLKIGMLKSNNTKLEINNNNIFEIMEEAIDDVQALLDTKNIEVTIVGSKKELFYFDVFWMREAIINLIKNSIEHSPSGTQVTITFTKNMHALLIEITDQGYGIEEKNIPFIFERFTSSIRQKDGNSGLGLSIAKQVAIRHFGEITVKNNKECGVTFAIVIPILKGEEVYNYYGVR